MLTILTPTHGKVDAIAYGARKVNSRKAGHTELFTCVDLLLNLHKEPGAITQIELLEPYLPLRTDLTLGAYAAYAVELLDRFTEIGDSDNQSLFALLRATLNRLGTQPDPLLVLRYYDLHLLEHVGFRPELTYCVRSGELIQPENQYFSFGDGGVVSPNYGLDRHARVSLQALKLMRHLQRNPYSHISSLKVSEQSHLEVEALLLGYITNTLERELQSAAFVRKVRQMR